METFAAVLVLLGAGFAVLAGVGVLRFPDVYARMHAGSKAATLALVLITAGAIVTIDDGGSRTKLVLVVALQFVTAPVAAHLVGRAAYRVRGHRMHLAESDELAGVDVDAEGGAPSSGPPERP